VGGARQLVFRLDSGSPITLGVFGASIGQNAGCLSQPEQRCMTFSGQRAACLPWMTRPKCQPFKGLAVRLLERINATWPHANHRITNAAVDATPAQHVARCLFTHLPTDVQLVVLEFGSMAQFLQLSAIENIVRQLLALPSQPALLILSFHSWCSHRYPLVSHTWGEVERETLRVCRKYGQSCVSPYQTLSPLVASGSLNRSDVVPEDCLHIVNARYAVDYVSQILDFWVMTVRSVEGERLVSDTRQRTQRMSRRLPAPLWEENAQIPPQTRCLAFVLPSGAVNSKLPTILSDGVSPIATSALFQSIARVEYWTAHCTTAGTWRMGHSDTAVPASNDGGLQVSQSQKQQYAMCAPIDRSSDATSRPCSRLAQTSDNAFHTLLARPLLGWFYCGFALGGSRKTSFGVVALVPGATLHAELPRISSGGGGGLITAKLTYLVAHRGMGVARLRCVGTCACDDQDIDAHRNADSGRANHSVFTMHTWQMRESLVPVRRAACGLQLRLLRHTTSGGHIFRVRYLMLVDGTQHLYYDT
jgi:hypothetical protein